MNQIEAMRLYAVVVRKGSLTAASKSLRMPLPTVSRKMTELERHLGATLLLRSTRGLELTDVGRTFLEASERVLLALDEAERQASGAYLAPRGELHVTAPVSFGRLHVLPVVVEFLQAFPEVDVRLSLSDGTLDLIENHIDAGIRIGRLPDSRLVAIPLGQVREVIVASAELLKREKVPARPTALGRSPCVTFSALAGADSWKFARQDVRVRSRLVVSTAQAAVDAAVAGVGFARLLSYQVAEECAAGKLRIVLPRFERPPQPVNLIYHRQAAEPAKLRAFIEYAQPRLRQRLLEIAQQVA